MTLQQDIEAVEAKAEEDRFFGLYWRNMEDDNGPVAESLYFEEVKKLMMETLIIGADNKDAIINELFDGARDYLKSCIEEDEQDLHNELNRGLNHETTRQRDKGRG